jgi:hypothetical protein
LISYIEYRIAKNQLEKFAEALNKLKANGRPPDFPEIFYVAQIKAAESVMLEMKELITEYESANTDHMEELQWPGAKELRLAVVNGLLVVDFGAQIRAIGLPREEALQFADALREAAMKIPGPTIQ